MKVSKNLRNNLVHKDNSLIKSLFKSLINWIHSKNNHSKAKVNKNMPKKPLISLIKKWTDFKDKMQDWGQLYRRKINKSKASKKYKKN